jgi:hypothetical protein
MAMTGAFTGGSWLPPRFPPAPAFPATFLPPASTFPTDRAHVPVKGCRRLYKLDARGGDSHKPSRTHRSRHALLYSDHLGPDQAVHAPAVPFKPDGEQRGPG